MSVTDTYPIPLTLEDWKILSEKTPKELEKYGMRRWSNDEPTMLMLVPHKWYKHLPNGLSLESIWMGEIVVVGTDYVDDDHRGGLLAYGIRVKKD